MKRLVPAIAPDVPPADDDLGLAALGGRAIVTEPALHPSRDANRDLPKQTFEPLVVVVAVPARQLAYDGKVGGIGLFARTSPPCWIRDSRNRELKDGPARLVANDTRPPMHEGDNRPPHFLVRFEEAVVDTELAAAVTDYDRPVAGESHPVLRAQPKAL